MNVFTTQQVREMDRQTAALGIDGLILMENAAFAVTAAVLERYGYVQGGVLVCAGMGNNGGDGFAAARQLLARGVQAFVILLGTEAECQSPDLLKNIAMAKAAGVPVMSWGGLDDGAFAEQVTKAGLVLDCIFGTGLSKMIEGRHKKWIELINDRAAAVLSVDVPSGIHSDTGRIMGAAVKAECTVTFQVLKPGLLLAHGRASSGQVLVCPIGIPEPVVGGMRSDIKVLTAADVPALLPARQLRSHKGDYGKVLCLCGSDAMPGALTLAAMAAYRAGCGLVYAASTQKAIELLRQQLPEAIGTVLMDDAGSLCPASLERLAEDKTEHTESEEALASNKTALESDKNECKGWASAHKCLASDWEQEVCILGPGLSAGAAAAGFVERVIAEYRGTLIVDADALHIISAEAGRKSSETKLTSMMLTCTDTPEPTLLRCLRGRAVLTPHPKEMSRLTGLSVKQILDDLVGTARDFAQKHGVVVVLKDSSTVTASPDGQVYLNTTGNASMAKGGSGDVLTGVIAALIAQKKPPFLAAALGVYYHGLAGDIACRSLSEQGVLARDIIDSLPEAMRQKGTAIQSFSLLNQSER